MAQPSDSDYDLASGQSGTAIRLALNSYQQGHLTKNSGATAPATTFPGMNWIDTSQSPPEWNIRNQADTAWNVFARIDPTTGIEILNQGAAVPGTAVANIFTQNQTIDRAGAAGSLAIRSDQTFGIAASLDAGGHDSVGNDTVYGSLDLEITDDTDGSEDGQWVIRALQAGVETVLATIGAVFSITGTLNATTLQQSGTNLADIIEAEKGNMDPDNIAGAATVPNDLTRGERNRFTGASASTWTIDAGSAGDVFPVRNRGSANITFAAGSGVTIVGGTTLQPDGVCTIEYDSATTALIYGQNI